MTREGPSVSVERKETFFSAVFDISFCIFFHCVLGYQALWLYIIVVADATVSLAILVAGQYKKDAITRGVHTGDILATGKTEHWTGRALTFLQFCF